MRRSMRILVLAALGMGLLATPVQAAKPQTERIVVDDLFAPDEFLSEACGVAVTSHFTGHFIVRLFTDANGDPVRELNNYAMTARYSSATASIFAKDVGVDRVTYLDDGSLIQVIIGSVQSFTAPGQGRVYADVGQTTVHITFDADGNPSFEILGSHGQHDPDQLAAICAILAG